MEEEAEKLKEMQGEVEKQMMSAKTSKLAAGDLYTSVLNRRRRHHDCLSLPKRGIGGCHF